MRPKQLLILLLAAAIASCSPPEPGLPENYHEDLATWKTDRDARLRSESGWVNLVGLYWLEPGENMFGSGDSGDIVFPETAPETIGRFLLKDSIVEFISEPDVEVLVDSAIADRAVVYDAASGIQRVMEYGRYRWFIIERAGNYGVRLRDLEHPLTKEPLGLDYFDWSEDWRVTAEYRPFDSARTVAIQNVVGFTFEEVFEGELVFEFEGASYALWPSMGEDYCFIMFGDATSGDESYGAGRYLVSDPPDGNGEVVLDFNKAYNPPCAFTDFATCPLPPEANRLKVAVRAGEKAWH